VAISLNNLAALLYNKGDYAAAEPLFREALALSRKRLGDQHPDVAISLNNLARLLGKKGDYAAAEPLIKEAVDIFQRSLPPGHWMIAQSRSNRGAFLMELKRYREAETELLAGYAGLKATQGEQHERTQSAINHLVELYQAWGKPDRAAHYRALLQAKEASTATTRKP
jgi:tetratricopeptide (TPR) repeat protein